MNILFLNKFNYLRGGSERVLFEEMRLLDEAGHRVAIFSRDHEKNDPAEFTEYFPPAMDTERSGLSINSLLTAMELIYSKTARIGLREVIKRFRPDIVHAHNIYGQLSVAVLDELEASGIPVVMTLHDLKLACPSYLMLNRGKVCEKCKGGKFYHAVLSRCHRNSLTASMVYAFETWVNSFFGKYDSVSYFIAPSRFLREKIIECGWDEKRFIHIPNFTDVENVADSSDRGDFILYLGRLSPEKGVGTLLSAYKDMRPELPLYLAGDGPERKKFERLTAESNLPVHFLGHLSGSSLQEKIAGARVIVVPSESYENAPMSILEAMAHGKPVIGAGIGGIPELIVDGVTGFLFEPGNLMALSKVLGEFLALSAEAVTSMGAAARRRAEDHFSKASHARKLVDIYALAIMNKSRAMQL